MFSPSPPGFQLSDEDTFTKALARFAQIDSRHFINFILELIDGYLYKLFRKGNADVANVSIYNGLQNPPKNAGFKSIQESVSRFLTNKELCVELAELLRYNYERIDFIDAPIQLNFDCPLDLHCSYSRDQVLVACDFDGDQLHAGRRQIFAEKRLDLLL